MTETSVVLGVTRALYIRQRGPWIPNDISHGAAATPARRPSVPPAVIPPSEARSRGFESCQAASAANRPHREQVKVGG